jgi:hypothetical protein
MGGVWVARVGTVTAAPQLTVRAGKQIVAAATVADLLAAWQANPAGGNQ